jgi:hypothetical protein
MFTSIGKDERALIMSVPTKKHTNADISIVPTHNSLAMPFS